jgi:uncharacterized protein YndB with AHSA1/START domain
MTSRVENETDLVLEKIFEAPRAEVFDLFANSEQLKEFWGPSGWELIHSEMDFRPEGEWHYGMRSVDEKAKTFGMESWGKSIYQEIETPSRIVYYDYFSDEQGEINREMPVAKMTIEFVALDEERTIVVSRARYNTAEELRSLMDSGMVEGVAETWDRLTDYISYRSV